MLELHPLKLYSFHLLEKYDERRFRSAFVSSLSENSEPENAYANVDCTVRQIAKGTVTPLYANRWMDDL